MAFEDLKPYGPMVCIASNEQVYGSSHRWAKGGYIEYFFEPHEGHRAKRKLTVLFYRASTTNKLPELKQHIQKPSQAVLHQVQYALDNITLLVLGPEYCADTVDHDCVERCISRDLKSLQFIHPLRDYEAPAWWCRSRFHSAVNDPGVMRTHSLLRPLSAEVLDNINAAEATVAVTATYLIWRITEAPEWQRRVRAELCQLPVQDDGFFLYLPHPASSGQAERIVPLGDHSMSGTYLPENTITTASAQALHHNGDVYSDPHLFLPERWLHQEETWKLGDAQPIPFGYSRRICLGIALATMEIKLLIATLYQSRETVMTPSSNAESMRQCSTYGAVPEVLKCVVRFQVAKNTLDLMLS
ncbi:cytochrome P450 [Xylaria grammica]|nr:cytochrome P450 [Xylaria grammica]